MPAVRNLRRSRRLSNRPPCDPVFEEPDDFSLYDDRQPSLPQEPAAPEPDVRRTHKGCKELSPLPAGALWSPEDEFQFVRRSSHSRKRDPDHIPRPPNAFMLFRSDFWAKEKIKLTVERDHRMISRIAGTAWNALSESERVPYRRMAEVAKRQHAELYPDYKYSPVFRKEKLPRRRTGKSKVRDLSRRGEVARLPGKGYEGDVLKERLKGYDRKSRKSELLYAPQSLPRIRVRATQAKKAPPSAQRKVWQDIRTQTPEAFPEDLIKMEPSTPDLSYSQLEDSPPRPVEPLPGTEENERLVSPLLVENSLCPKIAVAGQFPDDPPAVVDFAHDQGCLRSSFPASTAPVSLCPFAEAFGAAVDDAFSVSPMFSPHRSSSLFDPHPSMFDTRSPCDDLREVDYDQWLVSPGA